MNNGPQNHPSSDEIRAHIEALIAKFVSTPSGQQGMQVAENVARQLVAADVAAGVPYGDLRGHVAGVVLKGILFGMDCAAHASLTERAWIEMGGCALAHALVFDATPESKPIDPNRN